MNFSSRMMENIVKLMMLMLNKMEIKKETSFKFPFF